MVEYLVPVGVAAVLFYFMYSAGKKTAKAEVIVENVNAVKKAIKARNSIKSPADARWVLMEHAVDKLSVVSDSKTDSK